MSYEDVMKVMLPKQDDHSAHITGHYGEKRASGPHGGTDFNYEGGQAGINLNHPTVHAPVPGEVTFVGGQYGTIKIRDAEGNSHEILHTQAQLVVVGQQVNVGDAIGTMGGRGPYGDAQYAQHVHYQMKDSNGHSISPEVFWSQRVPDNPGTGSNVIYPPATRNILSQGMHGEDVRILQTQLAQLGYTDAHGQPLQPDAKFGSITHAAVKAFQADHHLTQDGEAGPATRTALTELTRTQAPDISYLRDASQTDNLAPYHAFNPSAPDFIAAPATPAAIIPALDQPSHPAHALFKQAQAGVQKLDASKGRTSDQRSDNLSAALVVVAQRDGLTRIDHVVLTEDASSVYAIQGELSSPLKKYAGVATVTAVATPLTQSSAEWMQQQTQQQTTEQTQQQTRAQAKSPEPTQ